MIVPHYVLILFCLSVQYTHMQLVGVQRGNITLAQESMQNRASETGTGRLQDLVEYFYFQIIVCSGATQSSSVLLGSKETTVLSSRSQQPGPKLLVRLCVLSTA